MLLSSLHHIVVLLALNLSSPSSPETTPSSSDALTTPFAASQRIRKELEGIEDARDELAGELAVSQEVMEKVKGLEGKLDYQITKLIGLAEAEKAKELVEDVDESEQQTKPLTMPFSWSSFPRSTVFPSEPLRHYIGSTWIIGSSRAHGRPRIYLKLGRRVIKQSCVSPSTSGSRSVQRADSERKTDRSSRSSILVRIRNDCGWSTFDRVHFRAFHPTCAGQQTHQLCLSQASR